MYNQVSTLISTLMPTTVKRAGAAAVTIS